MLLPTFIQENRCVVAFPEVVDFSNAAAVHTGLRRILTDHVGDVHTLVIDLSASRFVTAAALRLLEETHQQLAASGLSLHLVAGAPLVVKVLRVTGLLHRFPVHPCLDQVVGRGAGAAVSEPAGALTVAPA
ncbi:STAS domain-containing protein [Streptomyces rimosus]|uniref:STAS domain-containing protein n=1 Tax=Streptomyces rimosus TaxID=1927 RepID=UPI0037B2CE92